MNERTTMGKRVIAAAAAVLLGCGLLSSCHSGTTGTRATTAAAQASDTAAAAAGAKAVDALRTWLAAPLTGTLTISSVEANAAHKTEVSQQLTGTTDLFTGTASLTGTLNVLGGGSGTVQDPLNVIEKSGKLYSSIPTSELHSYPGRKWFVNDLASARAAGSTHSVWWSALGALTNVHVDGPSEVDGKSAVEYTGTVDLAKVPAAAAQVGKSAIFAKAGTTAVSIDLYTDLGSGSLVRLTYRLGLQVSVDSTPTAKSTAGYEVDLTGFGTPAETTASPVIAPAASLVETRSGSGDLCQLLLF
jgi:hypothetical protein